VPLYSVTEAAHHIDVPVSTFRTWTHGYERPSHDRRPVVGEGIVTTLPRDAGVSVPFVGLAEAHALAAIRRSGVPLQRIRPALQSAREALLWKLDGLSEYDIRRPLTSTGTNLLGLIKHVASVELGYFGVTFGRLFDEPLPWLVDDAESNADMWATADESREQIVGLYQRAWAHSDATIDTLALDAIGYVPHWPSDRSEVTLHRILVHVIAETHRHAGHADIVRELIDGAAGLREDRQHGAGRPGMVGELSEAAGARCAGSRTALSLPCSRLRKRRSRLTSGVNGRT